MLEQTPTTDVSALIARLLGDFTNFRLWKHLRICPERGVARERQTNTLTFKFEPKQDNFRVFVNFLDGTDPGSVLKTDDLKKALEKYMRGTP